jgi:hypothetical protein
LVGLIIFLMKIILVGGVGHIIWLWAGQSRTVGSGLLYWAGIVSGLDKTMQCLMKNLTIASIVLGWCSICWDRYDRWYWTDISYSLVLGWS